MAELKPETKREEREVDNTLGLRADQYSKKVALVSEVLGHAFHMTWRRRSLVDIRYRSHCISEVAKNEFYFRAPREKARTGQIKRSFSFSKVRRRLVRFAFLFTFARRSGDVQRRLE